MRPRATIDRATDRRITVAGAALAAALLLAALAALILPAEVRRGVWLPLHLALAGGAGLAIAAVLPFFARTLAAAPPAAPRLRLGAIALVGGGALAAVVGYPSAIPALAAAGAAAFVAGVALVGLAAFGGLGDRRRALEPAVFLGYGIALADVSAGALLVTLDLSGWPPLIAVWPAGKAAHAWLNLLGFVSLAIAATFVHLLPTVAGTRIAVRRSGDLAIGGLTVAAPLVATGMLVGAAVDPATPARAIADLLARLGALSVLLGALALAGFAVRTRAASGRWTTDAGWHRFILGGLGSAIAWFVVAAALAAGPVALAGADPAAWSIVSTGGPLVGGWVGLAILGALTHLAPSIGPGGPARHGRQRALLGRAASSRLALLDGGVALATSGALAGVEWASVLGAAVYGAGLLATLGLLARALTVPEA